jgi:hypothetical protein
MNSHLPITIEGFLKTPPFVLSAVEKRGDFLSIINQLTEFHRRACQEYGQIVRSVFGSCPPAITLEEVPFIPVRLFKSLLLSSINESDVVKTMMSSGTSGQTPSRIVLDRATSASQTRALTQIMTSVLGKGRHPMLIADSEAVVKDRRLFTARGAGIRGFSLFGRDTEFMLDSDMELRTADVLDFVKRYEGTSIFVFGFTFMVWEHIVKAIKEQGIKFSIPYGILLHGGGWKKLSTLNISNQEFKQAVKDHLGIEIVINYYGMVEQTGSIFLECERGYLHSSSYSDIIVRDPLSLEPTDVGLPGIVQLISVLPQSYPGHSILSEDVGVIHGVDNCECGWTGKYFSIQGRLKDAEIRGCSDTYAP